MNLLDLGIVAVLAGAAVGGWRLGLLARLLAWVGVAVALAASLPYVPRVVTEFGGTSADDRVTVALLFLVLAATIGQALGLLVGALVHRAVPARSPLPRWDRGLGALAGLAGVLVLVWMVVPSLATARGWPARLARDSVLVGAIDRYAPEQPARFAAWGRAISDAPYPSALGRLDDPPDPGRAPTGTLPPAVDGAARASMVKVSGRACRRIQEGTGWVAAPGTVVTNAHVVAGERETTVTDQRERTYTATVVAFDSRRDVAVLSVPDLDTPALRLRDGTVGEVGAVYGYPGGGELTASPARIGEEILAVGTDIYRTGSSRREVYVLAASLAPGDSGGPLVTPSGAVIAMAFAIDPAHDATAYALTPDEIRPALAGTLDREAGTGPCLVD